ncbi:HD-GYP domain-containing protein [Neobacillus vireti]|uniref:HD-GYP domain-containing protein n=1 Tax=Neobacillus vireti TaxID=220686 RepID=UPI0030000E9B
MYDQLNKWLGNPIFFRFGFIIILLLSVTFHYIHFHEDHLYLLFILATIFLGIGYYDKSAWFLVSVTTLIVICRFIPEPDFTTLLSFLILEVCYLIIMFISVSLMKSNQKIKEDELETILALTKALDSRDTYTSNHSQNVAFYAREIAKEMKLSKHEIETVYKGSLLHDIGKIGIPEDILLKPGKLSLEEYTIIKRHPVIGYEMIKHVSDFNKDGILDIVLYHHERYDGNGYPKGLKGEEIPFVSRIIAIADSFDAMTSKRVYRKETDLESTLKEIRKSKGSHFDPEITDVFLSLFKNEEKKIAIINQMKSYNDRAKSSSLSTWVG